MWQRPWCLHCCCILLTSAQLTATQQLVVKIIMQWAGLDMLHLPSNLSVTPEL
jgi:hypothetical protein